MIMARITTRIKDLSWAMFNRVLNALLYTTGHEHETSWRQAVGWDKKTRGNRSQ